MKIEDSFTIQAPLEDVWAYLLDVEVLARCIPGVSTLEAIDANSYRGQLTVKVGPIKAVFSGTATFTELEPPNRLVAVLEADDRATASKVKATFTSVLEPVEGGTRVAYTTDINLRGRLAQFGLAVVRGTAKKMTAQFGKCLQQAIIAGDNT